MDLVIVKELGKKLLVLLGKTIEFIFRCILCALPLGVYMLILQSRKKASSARVIAGYINDDSKWQYVFPGFMLISADSTSLTKFVTKVHKGVQNWIQENKYILALVFMCIVVGLMTLSYMRGGN